MRTPLAALLLAALLPVMAACGDSTGPEEEGIHGTYALLTINGNALPFALQDDAIRKFEVTRGSITLRKDGSFSDELAYRVTPVGGTAGTEDDVITGTFLENVGSLTFQFSGGQYPITMGTSGRLSQTIGVYTLEYRR